MARRLERSERPLRNGPARSRHRQPSLDSLTDREREVVAGLVEGLTNKQIGALLGISHRTVEVHRGRLMRKLGASSLSALLEIAFAQRRKLPALAGCCRSGLRADGAEQLDEPNRDPWQGV
ncbi:response regulator transcription factor [Rhizorhabdus dicambivorans]|uniref:response regulator transcription factor n=1 Tax=Rhizorhabdus dicambivorans TaxID=1850238 RepID=UPI000AF4321C|nr:helix-turn-helix transcriptional regulator [Rhizorhabdus dicambivorans]